MIKIEFDKIKDLVFLPLVVEPNYQYDVLLNGTDFNIQFRTVNNETVVSIWTADYTICNYITINNFETNIAYFSEYKDGVFFFLKNETIRNTENINFNEFDTNSVRFCYGSL